MVIYGGGGRFVYYGGGNIWGSTTAGSMGIMDGCGAGNKGDADCGGEEEGMFGIQEGMIIGEMVRCIRW
jgi:hypothetical protein